MTISFFLLTERFDNVIRGFVYASEIVYIIQIMWILFNNDSVHISKNSALNNYKPLSYHIWGKMSNMHSFLALIMLAKRYLFEFHRTVAKRTSITPCSLSISDIVGSSWNQTRTKQLDVYQTFQMAKGIQLNFWWIFWKQNLVVIGIKRLNVYQIDICHNLKNE